MITKHKLNFDPAASDDYDVVASFLKASDGTLITHTAGAIDVNIKTSDITLEVNLDFATDQVDASGSEVSLDAATLAALENITVSATDLDIRDLSASQDNVAISDGTDTMAVNTDGSINARSAGFQSCAYASKAIAATATDIVTVELSGRKSITLQNVGAKDVYVACDASVTTANGLLIPKGATAEFPVGDAINLHAIADGGTSELRVMELA